MLDPSQQVGRPDVLARTYLGRELPAADEVFGKGAKRRGFDAVAVPELAEFFGAQVAASLELLAELEARLEAAGQLALFAELEVPLVRVLQRMEWAGVRIDEGLLGELSQEIEADLGRLESGIYELAGLEMTPGVRRALDGFMAANPRGKHGRVTYDLKAYFGIDPAELRRRFDFYFERFPIRAE